MFEATETPKLNIEPYAWSAPWPLAPGVVVSKPTPFPAQVRISNDESSSLNIVSY